MRGLSFLPFSFLFLFFVPSSLPNLKKKKKTKKKEKEPTLRLSRIYRFVQLVGLDLLPISDDRVNSLRGVVRRTFLDPRRFGRYADERICHVISLLYYWHTFPLTACIGKEHAGNAIHFFFRWGKKKKKKINDLRRAMPITIQFFSRHFHHPFSLCSTLFELFCLVITTTTTHDRNEPNKKEMKSHGAWLAPCRF